MHLRRFLFPLIALVALSPPFLSAQVRTSGTIPSAGGGASCVSINVDAQATVAVQVTGTWTGTLQPEISVQGQAAANTQVTPSTSTTPASTITANGVYRASVAGGSTFLLCGNTVASGTANVFLNATTASAGSGLSGGGSGSGTVSPNNGSAGAVANYAAAAGSTTVGPDSNLTDAGNALTYSASGGVVASGAGGLTAGANGGSGGALNLKGATSGTATCTAPAVAGTVNNAVSCSNSMLLTSSVTGQGYFFGNSTPGTSGTGIVFDSGNGACLAFNGEKICAVNSGVVLTGSFFLSKLLFNGTAPTIAGAGCGGSAASIADNNGPASFAINVGTAPTSAGCTVTLPAATTAWNCWANDITTNSTSVFLVKQTARSTTSATFVNFSDVAVATAPTASDIWTVHCFAD